MADLHPHIPTPSRPCPRRAGGPLYRLLTVLLPLAALLSGCARMGQPDGGWYDERPPRVLYATPADGGTGVDSKRVTILFDEFIKLDNASEKVVISPPQLEQPDIKAAGKRIVVELKDSLKPQTTYTIDFSDAISDNNEGNPMGNYTYSFSTGEEIDTLEVSGYVLEAENLEPVKGILVGLYATGSEEGDSARADSAFTTLPMLRVSRTDSRGHFTVRGIKAGSYRVYALQDMDSDYKLSQKGEKLAFSHDVVVPTSKPDIRQDTIWQDSLRIRNIRRTGYTHFLPDDLVLTAFTPVLDDRYLTKSERQQADRLTFFFSYGDSELPTLRGLNFDSEGAFLVEASQQRDTVTYWLRDTALVNRDTLELSLTYRMTDTLGVLVPQTDTLSLFSKQPTAKRMKDLQKELETWTKKQERRKKRGLPYDSIMPPRPLRYDLRLPQQLDPDRNIPFEFPSPLADCVTSRIHLYSKYDTLWYEAPFEFVPVKTDTAAAAHPADSTLTRRYELRGEWRPEVEYSLEIDSAAFTDIYGLSCQALKQGFKVRSLDDYATVLLTLTGMQGRNCLVQLLNSQDQPVKEVSTQSGQAEFFYVKPGTYYLRLVCDDNLNGRWDTGDYYSDRQAEAVYYYPEAIECRAKWDLTQTWNPTARPLYRQKPTAVTKQKAEQQRRIQQRNAERARKMGIEYIEEKL